VQTLDISLPKFGMQYHLQILGGTIWVVIMAIQNAIFEDK